MPQENQNCNFQSILYLGYALPNEFMQRIFLKDTLPSVQTNKFGWSLIRVLSKKFNTVNIISMVACQNYAITKIPYFNYFKFSHPYGEGTNIPYLNITYIKNLSKFLSILFYILPHLYNKQKNACAVIHGISMPYLIIGIFLRLFGYKVLTIATDIPGVLLNTDSNIIKIAKKINLYLIKKIFSISTNAVIALSENLVKNLNFNKSYYIIPGFLDSLAIENAKPINLENYISLPAKTITFAYAGGLTYEYGVQSLIEGFNLLDIDNVELHLYGGGEMLEYVKSSARSNSRIKFFGFVDNLTLLKKLANVDLLINPRKINTIISENSFPSKLIEYICLGVPVATTKITSLPSDLSEYLILIDGDDASSIKNALMNFTSYGSVDRKMIGLNARNFLLEYLADDKIVEKITDLLKLKDNNECIVNS